MFFYELMFPNPNPVCYGSQVTRRHLTRCTNPCPFSIQKWALTRPYCALPIYSLLTCRDLSQQPGAFLVARFLVCNVVQIPIAHGRLYHTPWHTGKGLPEQHLSQMGPSVIMVGRQPRHRHQKDPFVYRGSHPCLDRKPRYYWITITAHLAVILSFLPFC
jgi:hypothetical protein